MLTLFSAAGESTASLLGSAAWILTDRPEIQEQLRENPELLGAFIEETLRYESPFRGHYRHVWRDTTLGGVEVPANSHLLLMWGAANRDPAHFEAPNEFRLDRTGAKGHVSFGKGVHFCVGAALARLEARIVLRMLLERTTWIEAATSGNGCRAFWSGAANGCGWSCGDPRDAAARRRWAAATAAPEALPARSAGRG